MSEERLALVRQPSAAGRFYPADPDELASAVDALLGEVPSGPEGTTAALIVPHAAYQYSGRIAATAYSLVRGSEISRVAVLGPAHFVQLSGCAVPGVSGWRTPLGTVPIDEGLRSLAVGVGARTGDVPHEPEHAVEVQLPFLQRLSGVALSVLPVAVGSCPPDAVAQLISAIVRDCDLIVVSTDLSHYMNESAAKDRDRRTADAVVSGNAASIGPEDACGVFALRGTVAWIGRADLDVRLLDLGTSAEGTGDPGRVVGYGAFAIR